jgi:hypothetical protein
MTKFLLTFTSPIIFCSCQESGDYAGLVAVAEEELRMRESLRDVSLHD